MIQDSLAISSGTYTKRCIFWAADGSLGETPENLLKWKTPNEGRIVHLLGYHLDGPALTLFEMQRE